MHVSRVRWRTVFVGLPRQDSPLARLQALQDVLSDLFLLHVDQALAQRFGQVRAALLDHGHPTPGMDLLIACTALEHDLTLVTANVRDFAHIPNLRLENWLA